MIETHKSYSHLLANFFSIVENDASSLIYHTRVFDTFILDQISNCFHKIEIDVNISDSASINFLETFLLHSQNITFFALFLLDIFQDYFNDMFNIFFDFSNRLFNSELFYSYFGIFLFFLTLDNDLQLISSFIIFFQNSEFFSFLNVSVGVFSEYLYYCDLFLYIVELFLILFIFLFLFSSMKNFFITTKLYDNVFTFFKQNNISFLEVTIVTTMYLSFVIFDTFVSFSEDDNFDTFFYIILVFIVIMFFFLSVAIDIQYFFIMSNTSNGDVSLRILFFDILNNFLSVLRVFLC